MATDDERLDETATEVTEPEDEQAGESGPERLDLDVEIDETGPCRKHVRITVPRADIERFRDDTIDKFSGEAEVPGFRKGRVPAALVERRFKDELGDQVKQDLLVASLEQLNEEHDLEPISQPELDIEALEIPEDGDFTFEFDVEVRPDFDLPDYQGLKIQRQVREITDQDVQDYAQRFLAQYGELKPVDRPAQEGDFVTVSIEFLHDGKPLNRISEATAEIKPLLHFQDAELRGFDELMIGAEAGDTREGQATISQEAESIELRGETVQAVIVVMDVKEMQRPELDRELLDRIGVESEEELYEEVRQILERRQTYDQRQSTRQQVLEKITESADWDLPERVVRDQAENALRREVLEMQQAGFTTAEIRARENELRQQALSSTRQALKEHFVLDRIAEEEGITVTPEDVDMEITMMAMQRGESPRRVRARLVKSGVIENLEAQIRERKAVDLVLDRASFEDVPAEAPAEDDVTAISQSVCPVTTAAAEDAEEADTDEDE